MKQEAVKYFRDILRAAKDKGKKVAVYTCILVIKK